MILAMILTPLSIQFRHAESGKDTLVFNIAGCHTNFLEERSFHLTGTLGHGIDPHTIQVLDASLIGNPV